MIDVDKGEKKAVQRIFTFLDEHYYFINLKIVTR